MTQKKMTDVMKLIFTRCHEYREAGQKEYAHDSEDALRNFNSAAERLGYDRKEILWIFLDKHLSGILSHIKGHTSQREDVTGRIGDAIVYLTLLEGMILEERDSVERFVTAKKEVTSYGTCERCGGKLLSESMPCPDRKEECFVTYFRSWCPKCEGGKQGDGLVPNVNERGVCIDQDGKVIGS